MSRRLPIWLAVFAVTAAPVSRAQDAPTFSTKVDLVTVDVVVLDGHGKPVLGLTRDDFEVFEDGRPQVTARFEAVDLPPAPPLPSASRPRVSANTGVGTRTGRAFVVVFDDLHLSPQNAQRGKAALGAFLANGVRDGDQVTLVTSGGGTWWSTRVPEGRADLLALAKTLDGRRVPDSSYEAISDYEALRVHVHEDTIVGDRVARRFKSYGVNPRKQTVSSQGDDTRQRLSPGLNDPIVETRAREHYHEMRQRALMTFEAVSRALRGLSGAPGRKGLVLVSEGFVTDPTLTERQDVIDAARRANVAIYFLDTRGLTALPPSLTAELGRRIDERDIGATLFDATLDAEGAVALADDTGGFAVRNSNDLSAGLTRISDDSRAYYLLGYQPVNAARDRRFRSIEVKVRRAGVKLRARRGYYPAAAATAESMTTQVQHAVDSPFATDGIPLRATSYVLEETLLGLARVVLVAEADVSGLEFGAGDGRFHNALDVVFAVAHRDRAGLQRQDDRVEMALLPETLAELRKTGHPLVRSFDLAPGGYQLKLVVRDQDGRLGSIVHDFEVPALDRFRVSTPILSDLVEKPSGEDTLAAVPLAHRTFESERTLYCQFEVYGATRDRDGRTLVSAGYELRGEGGQPLRRRAPWAIEPTSLGRYSRRIGLSLAGMAPGDYQLVVRARDDVTGQEQESLEPFTLRAATRGAANP